MCFFNIRVARMLVVNTISLHYRLVFCLVLAAGVRCYERSYLHTYKPKQPIIVHNKIAEASGL